MEELEELIKLESLSEKNTSAIYRYLNHRILLETYPISFPYSLQQARVYVEEEIQSREIGKRFAFAIILENEFTGVCALYDVNQTKKKAKLYYWVAVEFWNRGIATEAVRKLLVFAREKLKLESIETGVLQSNIGSIRVLEKNGFEIVKELVNTKEYHSKFKGKKILEMSLYIKNKKNNMNKKLEDTIFEIYADARISPAEFLSLKKLADRDVVELLLIDGDEGTTNALCKSFEVTNQLLQLTLLSMKRDKNSVDFKESLMNVINSQIELLVANTVLFEE